MLNMKTLTPKLRNQNHDTLFCQIKRRLNHCERLDAICSDLGIAQSTASNILQRNGTSITEEKNKFSSKYLKKG